MNIQVEANKVMDLEMRKCTQEDLEMIRSLSEKTFMETFGADNKEEDMNEYLKENFSSPKLLEELINNHSIYYAVFFKGSPAAYMKVNFMEAQTEKGYPDSLEIQRIYVLKKYKGQQMGRKLIGQAVETAKRNGLKYIWLGVWEHNTAAKKFYEKLGFVKIDTHVFLLGEDEQTDEIMKLNL